MKTTERFIKKWRGYQFSQLGYSEEFKKFAREFKKALLDQVKDDFILEAYSPGTYYISGFIKHKETDQHLYFSTSDVRFFPDEFINNVLIRTADDVKDYTGGMNHYTPLAQLGEKAGRLIKYAK